MILDEQLVSDFTLHTSHSLIFTYKLLPIVRETTRAQHAALKQTESIQKLEFMIV